MSHSPSPLPANPSLEQLQKRAKERLRRLRAAGDDASTLAQVQFTIAREYGFESWPKLKRHIESVRPAGIRPFEHLAADLAAAFTSGDEPRVRTINANLGTAFPTDFHDPEKMRQCMATWYASETRTPDLAVVDAREMVARSYGFTDWQKFAASLQQPAADPRSAPYFVNSRPPFYTIDWDENRLCSRGPQTLKDWQAIFAVIEEYGIAKVEAGGISDDAMRELSEIECITHLNIAGPKALTDDGARFLSKMPQLLELEIGGWHTALTDAAFEPLRDLCKLRTFKSCWTPGLTDIGAAHLRACENLESVSLMGSYTGDGLIRALAGKAQLRFLETGRRVTDEGISELRHIPVFARWIGGDVLTGMMGTAKLPNRLMIDGDFTDAGLAALEGLEGVAALQLFWHSKQFTSGGLEVLRTLPHLEVFGIDGDQCNDQAMRAIAKIPRLRQLQAQGAVAGDKGWEALSHSKTLEYIWGRECPNFGSEGFRSLARLPALRGMGISCKQVDDDALALLPTMPALRQFVSIDVPDEGFRHIGRCLNLESLYCMYCRDTTDSATRHIAPLTDLRVYYAGMTLITDRSLEILAGIESLEKLEFWQCMQITDAGVHQLAALPKLKELEIHGSPKVSAQIRQAFRKNVAVKYEG